MITCGKCGKKFENEEIVEISLSDDAKRLVKEKGWETYNCVLDLCDQCFKKILNKVEVEE